MTDDVLGVIGTIAGPVAPGATNTLNSLAPFVLSSVTNIGDVVANPTDSLGTDLADLSDVTASDDAVVQVVGPALNLVKTAGNAADGAVEYIAAGDDVTYTYQLVNVGNTYLSDITVTDDVLGVVGTIAGPVAPGATNTLTLVASNLVADVINLADAVANPTDDLGNDLTGIPDVTASDDAAVDVVAPALNIVKTAGNAADGTVEFILSGEDVTYTYELVNTGDTYLSDITVTDDVLGVVGTIAGPVAPGETNSLSLVASNVVGRRDQRRRRVGQPDRQPRQRPARRERSRPTRTTPKSTWWPRRSTSSRWRTAPPTAPSSSSAAATR